VTTVITAIRNGELADWYHTSGTAVQQVGWKALDVAPARKAADAAQPKGSMLDNVVGGKESDRDENDNVIDRITGKEVFKPGDRRAAQQNITVPSPGAPPPSRSVEDK